MVPRHRSVLTAAAIGALLFATVACGEDSTATPPAEEVASSLMSPADLGGDWAVNPGPDDAPMPDSGIVTDDVRPMLPKVGFCELATADQQAAVDAVRWQAFRQFDMTPADPVDPPSDPTGNMVFAQQFLLGAEPEAVTTAFTAMRDGLEACLGELPADDEGPGFAAETTVPTVGDDRYGVLTTIEEAGGDALWRLHTVVVRKATVLMVITVVDIVMGDVEPQLTSADVDAIVTTAAGRL